jgi:predicted DNA-binding transcriptional regulator YafY
MNQQICDAIRERRLVQFYYEGHQRIVQPHAYGIHKDTKNDVLRAYQIGGYSSSGNIPGWRLYKVSKISNIKITDKTFENPAPGYRKNDSAMSYIYCQI